MKILTKKIFREIRFNKFRSILIILTVFVAMSFGIGFLNIVNSAKASVEANDELLNNADLRIRLTEFISENDVVTLLTESERETAGITNLEGRIFEYASVIYNEDLYNAYLIGVDLGRNAINTLQLRSGTIQLSANQVLVEQHFSGALLFGTGASLNEHLTINFRDFTMDVTIAGFVADSEYLFVVDEQTEFLTLGQLCVIYMPLKMMQERFNLSGINEILVKSEERSHNASQNADQALSTALGEFNIQKVIYWDKTADKKMLDLRMNLIQNLGLLFSLFSLIAGSIAIYNSLSKLIMAQRAHIGLYGALGARNRDILSHYISIGIVLGIIGIVLGWLGAALINFQLINIGIINLFGLVTTKIEPDLVIWISGTVLTIIVVFVFSFLSTLPVLRLTPHEAMKAPYSTSELGKEPLLEQLLRPFGIFSRLISKIPLRTVFMNKKRSLSTALAVAASMVILVTSTCFAYDYFLGVDQNYSDYEKYDVQVILQQPISECTIKNWIRQNTTGIQTVEGIIYTNVWIDSQRVPLQVFHQNTTLREFHIIKGTKELNKDKLLMGSVLAKNLGVEPGDQLNLVFDLIVQLSVEVAGITGELLDNSLLWTIEALQQRTNDAQSIGISENITGFVFNYEKNLSGEEKMRLKQLIQEKYQP
ncbi:MAG: FtsX-like permease family protein, partial [Candidatus Hodarchaeota archaeon]